jgi:hypothetical protein
MLESNSLLSLHTELFRMNTHYRNLGLCGVLGALPSAFYRALGKVLLSITTTFNESMTLRHINTLGKEIFAECQTLDEWQRSAKDRQQPSESDGRHLYRAPSFGTRQKNFFAECPAYDTRQSMLRRVPSLDTRQSIFYFFLFPTKLFVVCSYTM